MRCVKEEQKGELKRTRKELHMERSWRGGGIGMCEARGGDGFNAEHVDGLPGNN